MLMKIVVTTDTSLKELAGEFSLTEKLIRDSNLKIRQEVIQKGEIIHIPGWKIKGENSPSLEIDRNHIIYLKYPNDLYKAEMISSPLIDTKKNYDFFSFQKDISTIQECYPFVKKRVIGQSVLGAPIYELIIGQGKQQIHMNGSFHANEWITTAIIMKWLDDYLRKIVHDDTYEGFRARELYESRTISLVPMVNPDGVNLVLNKVHMKEDHWEKVLQINEGIRDFSRWKANIRGVDLNNQYPAFWEIEKQRKIPKSPAPRDFPGTHPLTEPEAIAMAKLVDNSNFDRIIAFHTQGEEIYWGYLNREPEESQKIVKEFSRISGYKAVRYIDSHAGFRDWFIYRYRKPGFTVELGLGVNPLPLTQFDEIFEKAQGIFWASLYM
jgi:g-D-glutamyl-meso-diaminopimelate peptidase